jgi:hypothetical protein
MNSPIKYAAAAETLLKSCSTAEKKVLIYNKKERDICVHGGRLYFSLVRNVANWAHFFRQMPIRQKSFKKFKISDSGPSYRTKFLKRILLKNS